MDIKDTTFHAITITGAKALDPVTVIFRDDGPGRGGIIVECYGKTWAAYWGGMGQEYTVRQFVALCDAHYITNRLWRDTDKRTKPAQAYLFRIVEAILSALALNIGEESKS